MSAGIRDWTRGAEAIAYQACGACRHVWYFRRGFCPSCGGTVFYRADGGALLGITTASLDEPNRFVPVKWSHAGSAPSWLPPLLGNRT